MKSIILLMVMLLEVHGLELSNPGCVKGYTEFRGMFCINEYEEFIDNGDNTLSCKDSNLTIHSVEKNGTQYIDCNETKAANECMPYYKHLDDICVRTEDNIVKMDGEYVCNGRGLRYTTFDISEGNGTTPHLMCIEKPRIIELMFLNDNADRYYYTIPLLGKGIVGVSKDLGINNIKLIGRGEFITYSNKKTGLLLLSDIMDMNDSKAYKEVATTLEYTLRYVIKDKTLIGLKDSVYKDPKALNKVIMSKIPDNVKKRFTDYDYKTIYMTMLNISYIITDILLGSTAETRPLILNYILEEYHHILELVARDSLKV